MPDSGEFSCLKTPLKSREVFSLQVQMLLSFVGSGDEGGRLCILGKDGGTALGTLQWQTKPWEQAAHGYFWVQGWWEQPGLCSAWCQVQSWAGVSFRGTNSQPEIHGGFFSAFISGFSFLWRLVCAEISSSSDSLPAFLMGKNSSNASLDHFVHSSCVLRCLKQFNR